MSAKGIVIPADGGRRLDGLTPGGRFDLKLVGRDTADSIMLFEEICPVGRKSLYHLHRDSDEVIWVVAGEFSFKIGDEVTTGGPGTCAFFPRNVVHAWKNRGTATARVLFLYTPGTAGRYVEDLSPLIAIGEELGELLSKKAVAALGIDGAKAHSYGKAAAVGENGELEHAAAILHPKMGAAVRKVLSKGAALIPSSKKRSGPGTTLDIPLGHKDAAFVRSHFDGMEVQINDAPRANEIMVAVAVTDSGRPLPRVGGLTVAEIKGEDGLR